MCFSLIWRDERRKSPGCDRNKFLETPKGALSGEKLVDKVATDSRRCGACLDRNREN